MEKFKQLGLSDELCKVLHELGFEGPREIQAKTIPLAIAGKDVIGGSATGSGKTLAFGASIIEHAVKGRGIQALILTPTRELAEQVADSLANFSKYKRLAVYAIYGGVSINPQIGALERADIVVGTPGRILDHLERRTLDLRGVKTLVLDEADRMLDMGFIEDVERIIHSCPKERQTMLFSATISQDITHLSKKYMIKPEYVNMESYVDPSKLKQVYYDSPQDMKFSLLVHLLKHEHPGLIMIFCNTQRNTDFIANNLRKYGIDAVAIHGGLTQARRSFVMDKFRENKVSVLVCTDVAARGLDITGVSHVYNYDLPASSKEYVHRIGRTARAGKDGIAINIVSQRDYENFRSILKVGELKIERLDLPKVEQLNIKFESGGFGGRSGGGRFGGRGRSFGGGGFGGRGGSRGRFGGQRGGYGSRSGGRNFGRSSSSYGRSEDSSSGESSGKSSYEERRSFGSRGRSSFGGRSRSGGRGGFRGRSFGNRRY